jgi:uncharacterized protein YdeI (YjbR/CyaY-like superfamily)
LIFRIRGEIGIISLPEKDREDLMTLTKAPILLFPDVVALEAYMSSEPARSTGFWLKLSKIGAPKATISKGEAIEAAICCGWIDGQLAKFDEHHFLIRMTPRRAGSRWSAENRETAERLAREGRLKANGLEQIERAKTDGRWDAAYQSQGKAEAPSDLLAALARNTKAKRFFETLDRANRYSIIYRVSDAKLPRTRSRRIAQFVEMLARGETIHPAKAKKPSRHQT